MLGKSFKSKTKPLHQRRKRAKPTLSLNSLNYQRRKKRKSTENDTSTHLSESTSDLTVTSEDELPRNDDSRHEGFQKLVKVPMKQSVSDVSGEIDIQGNCSDLEGTRRVLKFDTSPNGVLDEEPQKTKHHLVLKSAGGNLKEGRADCTVQNGDRHRRLHDVLREDSDVFRTPTDLYSSDLKISRKSRPLRSFGAQRDSFRTMLAALQHGQNQIIKESHH